MTEGLDWLLRPVARGWCRYESLIDGSIDIADIAVMNDAMDVIDENSARARAAAERE